MSRPKLDDAVMMNRLCGLVMGYSVGYAAAIKSLKKTKEYIDEDVALVDDYVRSIKAELKDEEAASEMMKALLARHNEDWAQMYEYFALNVWPEVSIS